MEYELTPEPPPDERDALLAALEQLVEDGATAPAYASAWRRVGIRENVEDDA